MPSGAVFVVEGCGEVGFNGAYVGGKDSYRKMGGGKWTFIRDYVDRKWYMRYRGWVARYEHCGSGHHVPPRSGWHICEGPSPPPTLRFDGDAVLGARPQASPPAATLPIASKLEAPASQRVRRFTLNEHGPWSGLACHGFAGFFNQDGSWDDGQGMQRGPEEFGRIAHDKAGAPTLHELVGARFAQGPARMGGVVADCAPEEGTCNVRYDDGAQECVSHAMGLNFLRFGVRPDPAATTPAAAATAEAAPSDC